jgi:hypothetical protein
VSVYAGYLWSMHISVLFVAAISVVQNIETLSCEVERIPSFYNKQIIEYCGRNLKQKLWCEVCESVVESWT